MKNIFLIFFLLLAFPSLAHAVAIPPDCPTNAGTKALNYSSSTNNYSCNAVGLGTSGIVQIPNGGTGASTAQGALTNFGIVNTNGDVTAYYPEGDELTAQSDSGGATTRYVNLVNSNFGSTLTASAATGNQACDVAYNYALLLESPPATLACFACKALLAFTGDITFADWAYS